jgi:hypothetical protein
MGMRILGALVFTYFFSRLTMRLPLPLRGTAGLLAAHAISIAAIALMLLVLRVPLKVFSVHQLIIFAVAQVIWFAIDVVRNKHPVSQR